MIVYLIAIFIILLFGITTNANTNKKSAKRFIIFSFIILTIIACLRGYNVGVDTRQYYDNFYKYLRLDFGNLDKMRYEIGFSYLCKILSLISQNPQILIIVSSFFVNLITFRFIYKNSNNVILSTSLYIFMNFYFSNMNIMRQAIALAIILISYEYLIKNKKMIFIILVLIASLFHASAILSLLFLIIKKIKYNKNSILIFLIAGIACLILGKDIFEILINISPRLKGYSGSAFDVENYFGALINSMTYIISFLVGMVIIIKYKKEVFQNKNHEMNLLIGLIGVCCMFSILIMRVSIFNRFIPYFSIFFLIWMPNCIKLISNKKDQLFINIITFFLFFVYFMVVLIFRPEWYGVIPYNFFW